MHPGAYNYVAKVVAAHGPFGRVLEVGGRNINGSVRPLFGPADYTTLDISPGDGVDIVADAADWVPAQPYDAVVCCEVLEHTARAREIVAGIAAMVAPGGALIFTAACPPRAPHSGIDGGEVRPGEFYANVDPTDLSDWLNAIGIAEVQVDHVAGDVYAYCRREG